MKDVIQRAIKAIDSIPVMGTVDPLDIAEDFVPIRQELQQLLDEPDDLTIAYMAGYHRGRDAGIAEAIKEKEGNG